MCSQTPSERYGDAFETARLERKAFEERFWVDVLLGDLKLANHLRTARGGTSTSSTGGT